MANYYSDHPEIAFHLEHPQMKRLVELREKNYEDAQKGIDYAPVDFEDAMENYRRVLEITGDVAANTLAVNSESVVESALRAALLRDPSGKAEPALPSDARGRLSDGPGQADCCFL